WWPSCRRRKSPRCRPAAWVTWAAWAAWASKKPPAEPPPLPLSRLRERAGVRARQPPRAKQEPRQPGGALLFRQSVLRQPLQIHTKTNTRRRLPISKRRPKRQRPGLPDPLPVAHRQPALAALEAGADRDAPARALGPGGVDRHVQHRRAHGALAVDPLVLPVQAAVHVAEAVVDGIEAVVQPAHVEAHDL